MILPELTYQSRVGGLYLEGDGVGRRAVVQSVAEILFLSFCSLYYSRLLDFSYRGSITPTLTVNQRRTIGMTGLSGKGWLFCLLLVLCVALFVVARRWISSWIAVVFAVPMTTMKTTMTISIVKKELNKQNPQNKIVCIN